MTNEHESDSYKRLYGRQDKRRRAGLESPPWDWRRLQQTATNCVPRNSRCNVVNARLEFGQFCWIEELLLHIAL